MTSCTGSGSTRGSRQIAGRHIGHRMGMVGVVGQNEGGMANRTSATTYRHRLSAGAKARGFVRTIGIMAVKTGVM